MRIYIDEDMAAGVLVSLLQKAGHDLDVPSSAGMFGRSDANSDEQRFHLSP
jgi:hypothetical protein